VVTTSLPPMRSNPADARIRTRQVVHKISVNPSANGGADPVVVDDEPLIEGAMARVFIRRDASDRTLRRLRICLRRSAVGAYAVGRTGSPRSGYWTTVDVEKRSDLDQLRVKARRLIDGWKNFR
jgi:hypothetical protein